MIVEAYNWIYNFFFAGDLPAILAPIAEELSALFALLVVGFAFAPVIGVIILFLKFFSSFCRY